MLTKIPEGTLAILEILVDDQRYTLEELNNLLPQYPLNTLRYAIRRLLETKIIQSHPDLQDMRSVKYRISSEGKLSAALDKLPVDIATVIGSKMETDKSKAIG